MEENLEQSETKYLAGKENRAIRYWFYLENGLTILNEFRNLFLGVIALYFALKLQNPIWMILMFVPSIIILTLVGYYQVHKIAKIKEWISMRYSTHFGILNFDYTKATYELLTEILAELKKRGKV